MLASLWYQPCDFLLRLARSLSFRACATLHCSGPQLETEPSTLVGSGTVRISPGGGYLNNMVCTWTLFPRPGKHVRLTFTTFDVRAIVFDGARRSGVPMCYGSIQELCILRSVPEAHCPTSIAMTQLGGNMRTWAVYSRTREFDCPPSPPTPFTFNCLRPSFCVLTMPAALDALADGRLL